jgi:CHAT domain-containing protein/tetratricopeptide (TPR) repeat protein
MHRTLVCACIACLHFAVVAPASAQSPAAALASDARMHLRKGSFLQQHQQYDGARTELLIALRQYEELADPEGQIEALNYLGWTAFVAETNAAADAYWIRALAIATAIGHRHFEVELLHNRAFVIPSGPAKDALLERTLALARETGHHKMVAGALYKMGQEASRKGQYGRALEMLEEARRGFEVVPGRDHSVARVLLEIGRVYLAHRDFDRALAYCRDAANIMQRYAHKEGIAQTRGAMADIHRAAGRLPQALAMQREALAVVRPIGVRVANVERHRLAEIYLEMGEYRRAKTLLDEIIAGDDLVTRYLAYYPMAEALFGLGLYREARDLADLAIRFSPEPELAPFMLAERARAQDKLGDTAAAAADVDQALRLIEERREHLIPVDRMKHGYGERVQQLFAFAIELRSRLGRHDAALEASEQARARAFLDLLATTRAQTTTADPATLTELKSIGRRLNSAIVSYWVSPAATYVWVTDVDGRVRAATIPVSSETLAALVGQTSAEPETTPRPRAGSGTTNPIIAAGRTPIEVWRELHTLLIRPVQDALPTAAGSLLTIVPHGPLFRLSFAALVDEQGTYLLERYRLHYVPSGGALLYLKRSASETSQRPRYLLVGNPDDGAASSTLARLPGAEREVAAIARMLPSGTATVLTGADATESRVRGLIAGQTVVHIATHGVLYDDQRVDSFLALGGHGRDAASDGRLTAAEIYNLSLTADLVVLSACRSARGPVTGDGVLGMTRAFASAGTPSVLAALWDVADEAGAELMPAFYRHWHAGASKSAALRAAQLDLLARLRASQLQVTAHGRTRPLPEHPLLWAGFVLVGEP